MTDEAPCECGMPELMLKPCKVHGCARCGDVILVDTEDWEKPVCFECWRDVGANSNWHLSPAEVET